MVDGFDGLVPHLSRSRPDPDAGFARAASEASGLQAEDGLEHSLGLVGEHRLQLRPRGVHDRGEDARADAEDRGQRVDLAEALEGLPPIAHQNAAACGTDVLSYICESPVVSAFALEDGAVYQTYTTTWRGLEFIMGYYPILDRAPKGRDEGHDDWQTWIRRHDEYRQS
jgi:hypothetical protein